MKGQVVNCLACKTTVGKCRVVHRDTGAPCCGSCSHALTPHVVRATLPVLARRSPLSAALSTSTPARTSARGVPLQGPTSALREGPMRFREYHAVERIIPVSQGEISFRHWTHEGRDTLARILRRTLERNGVVR